MTTPPRLVLANGLQGACHYYWQRRLICSPIKPNIQSIPRQCTHHFIVCGERHFDYLVKEHVEHYHTERPHQSLGNTPLTGRPPEPRVDPPADIVYRKRLGGLLKHYERAA